jgi:LysR family glycine cleavage system transcriptional activator
LGRVPLVYEAMQRGELVEPFGSAGRIGSPFSYWMLVAPRSRARPEVQQFCAWIDAEAAATQAAVGDIRSAC